MAYLTPKRLNPKLPKPQYEYPKKTPKGGDIRSPPGGAPAQLASSPPLPGEGWLGIYSR